MEVQGATPPVTPKALGTNKACSNYPLNIAKRKDNNMATKKNTTTLTDNEVPFVIEGLRKLALQLDTKRKYALDEESDSFDEEQAEGFTEDIEAVRDLLKKLGDTKALVLKSERKAKAKAKPKAKAVITKAKAEAKVAKAHKASSKVIAKATKAQPKAEATEAEPNIESLLESILGL